MLLTKTVCCSRLYGIPNLYSKLLDPAYDKILIGLYFGAGQVWVFKTFRFPEPNPKKSRKFRVGQILDFSSFLHMLHANSTLKCKKCCLTLVCQMLQTYRVKNHHIRLYPIRPCLGQGKLYAQAGNSFLLTQCFIQN